MLGAQWRLRSTWASLSTWGKLRSLAIIRVHSEASDQTGQMLRLIWVFAGRKGHFVGFVMMWHILPCLTCIDNTDYCYFEAFYFLELPEKARVFVYPCTCMLVSIYYVILQTSSNTHLYLSRQSQCSYSLLVSPRGGIRVVYLMVNGYASMSNRRSIITTGLKLFHISKNCCRPNWHCPQWLSNPRLRHSKLQAITVNVTIGIVRILCWLTWQLYLAFHSMSSKYMLRHYEALWVRNLVWVFSVSTCRFVGFAVHWLIYC